MSANHSTVFKKQAEICITLVGEMDRAVVETRRSVDHMLADFYRRHREYGSRDRRFFSNTVFSWFRWRGWLKTPTRENVATALIIDAEEIPPQMKYLVENTSLSRSDLHPLGPLSIDGKAAGLQNLLKSGRPNIKQLVPDWFPGLLYTPNLNETENHLAQCIGAFQVRPPVWLRLRSDKIDKVMRFLIEMKIETGTQPFIEQAVYIKGSKNHDLSQLRGAEAQDLASQCAGLCCNPKPGEQWWDLCAGAGGKSLHLADLMNDDGLILATDIRPAILNQFSKRLNRNKYHSIRTLIWDGFTDPAPDKYFDGILVDAPCSGLGTWHRNPDARWRISPDQIRHYAGLQSKLLEIAANKIKPGGRLVYSTCALTVLENTDLIKLFLEQHQNFKLEQIFNPLTRQQTNGLIWIWPWEWNCNGMFIAVLEKSK